MKNNNIKKNEYLGFLIGVSAVILMVFVVVNVFFGQNAKNEDYYSKNFSSIGNVSENSKSSFAENYHETGDLIKAEKQVAENEQDKTKDDYSKKNDFDSEVSGKKAKDTDILIENEEKKEELDPINSELLNEDLGQEDNFNQIAFDNNVIISDKGLKENGEEDSVKDNETESEKNEPDTLELAEEDTRYKEIDEDFVDLSKYANGQMFTDNVYYAQDGQKVLGEQIIGDMKYNFASDGRLYKESGIKGIDVSTYQGNIDWNAVKNSGVKFVIIRVGYRGYTKGGLFLDDKCEKNINGATAAGLKVGLYIFSQAVNDAEAVEEANYCLNIARRYKISYPIYIDSEYSNGNHNGRADGLDRFTRTSVCKAFCETIKSAGYTPGVYASKSWFYNNLDYRQLNPYKIWLAHYCGVTDYKGKYDMWQHSSTGSVSGISGNVDMDYGYLGY